MTINSEMLRGDEQSSHITLPFLSINSKHRSFRCDVIVSSPCILLWAFVDSLAHHVDLIILLTIIQQYLTLALYCPLHPVPV